MGTVDDDDASILLQWMENGRKDIGITYLEKVADGNKVRFEISLNITSN